MISNCCAIQVRFQHVLASITITADPKNPDACGLLGHAKKHRPLAETGQVQGSGPKRVKECEAIQILTGIGNTSPAAQQTTWSFDLFIVWRITEPLRSPESWQP